MHSSRDVLFKIDFSYIIENMYRLANNQWCYQQNGERTTKLQNSASAVKYNVYWYQWNIAKRLHQWIWEAAEPEYNVAVSKSVQQGNSITKIYLQILHLEVVHEFLFGVMLQ